MTRFRQSIVVLLWAAAGAQAAAPDLEGYREIVQPFLAEHCTKCHGEARQSGDIRLHDLSGDVAGGGKAGLWERVYEMLVLGEMPPAKEPQPDGQIARRIAAWIREELQKGGRVMQEKWQLPTHGNYVDHDALFNQAPRGVPRPPARLWRLRPAAYEAAVDGIARGTNTATPFSLQTGGGFGDYASLYRLDDGTLGLLLGNARAIARRQTAHGFENGAIKRLGATPEPFLRIIDPNAEAPGEAALLDAIDWQYGRVLQRRPTAEERATMLAFGRGGIARHGRLQGLRNMLSAVLLTPEALYRMELGSGEPDEHGRRRLAGREIAYALGYALSDSRPDAVLLAAAQNGSLGTREAVAGQVQRLLEDASFGKPRILGFFREYFGYAAAADVFKDEKLNREHHPLVLIADTDQLVRFILDRDKDVLRELLTTRMSFVNHVDDAKAGPRRADSKRLVHLSYNLPRDWKFAKDQPIELPAGQRAGILTQPSWLVAKSGNFDNDIIHRGKWIRERLLGGTIPDLPITVDARLPDEPHEPLRHRMRVTREQYCWRCHERMNPLGEPFEMFDHFGRWRAHETLVDRIATEKNVDSKGKSRGEVFRRVAYDASGAVVDSGDPRLNGTVGNAVSMIHRLAGSDRVRQVFIRHVFRYFMGRNETLDDAATLQAAEAAYVASDGSFKALLVSLLSSDSFLMRRVEGEAGP